MKALTRILILGAVLAVVFIITLWTQQQVAQGQAPAPCPAVYPPLPAIPALTPPPKLRMGTRPGNQAESDWEAGLSASEKKFLQDIGQFLANQDEPIGLDQMHHPRALVPSVQKNPRYCYLNYPPWVYICG